MNIILKIISFLGLGLTVIPAFLVFTGIFTLEQHQLWMMIGTIAWFTTSPFWLNKEDPEEDSGQAT